MSRALTQQRDQPADLRQSLHLSFNLNDLLAHTGEDGDSSADTIERGRQTLRAYSKSSFNGAEPSLT
jgi:hypothetical protein